MGQGSSRSALPADATAPALAADASIGAAVLAPLSGGARGTEHDAVAPAVAATAAAPKAKGKGAKGDCAVCSDMAGAGPAQATAAALTAGAAAASAAAPAPATAAAMAVSAAAATASALEAPNASLDSRVMSVWAHNNINERVTPNPQNPQRAVAYMHSGCPLNRREVGRAAWAYLHTVAAYYPDAPTAAQQQLMTHSMHAMAEFFPCGYCADKTQEHIAKHPPQVHSQVALAMWLCGVHNEVNERMGKPLFACTPDALRARWKTGSEGCRGK